MKVNRLRAMNQLNSVYTWVRNVDMYPICSDAFKCCIGTEKEHV